MVAVDVEMRWNGVIIIEIWEKEEEDKKVWTMQQKVKEGLMFVSLCV